MFTHSLFFQIISLYFLFGTEGLHFDSNENEHILKRTLPLDFTTFSWSNEKSLVISPFCFYITRQFSHISKHKKYDIINTLFGCQRYQTNKTHQNILGSKSVNIDTNGLKKTSFIMKSRILQTEPLSSYHKTSPHLIITLHKFGAIVSLFLVGVVGSYLPYCFHHKKNFHTVMTFVNSFSTGSFFGLMFFHLTPEIAYISKNSDFGFNINNQFYDLTSFCIFWGFFSVFLLEKIIAPAILAKTKQPQFLTHCHTIASPVFDEENSMFKEKENCHQTPQDKATAKHSLESPTNKKEYSTQSKISVSNTHHGIIFDGTPSTSGTDVPITHSHKSNDSTKNPWIPIISPSFFVIFLVCFALCFHSVTEGIIIGLLSDSLSIWIATLSVCGHKCVASFSLAANCLQGQLKKNICILFLIIFSLSSPFGVLIGLLSYMPDSKVFVFINCVSLGAIMYAACDMAFSEFHHFTQLKTELKKVACLLLGATIILLLTLLHYATGSHDHHHT